MIRAILSGLAFALAGVLLTAWYWSGLPDPMPTHWNAAGQPDDFMPRIWGVLIGPLVSGGVPLLIAGVARLDPRRSHVDRNVGVMSTIAIALAAFGFGLQWFVLEAATSATMALDGRVVMIGVGLLWIVLGNVLPKVKSNWFVGIRTPWTLQSEKVWHVTHRVGGWSFALGGLVAIVASLVLTGPTLVWVALPATTASALVPVVYSYIAYKRLENGTAAS